MTEKEIWKKYKEINPHAESYDKWSFGGTGDELADLVLQGVKTTTASAYQLYLAENSPLPPIDGYNIILKSNGEAACITRTTDVKVCKYCDVTKEHAFNEGEGDRSLAFWRKVHKHFFELELKEIGLQFDKNMLVVCEKFEVVCK